MSLGLDDLNRLRLPIAAVVVATIAGAALVWWTTRLITREAQVVAAQEAQLRQARDRFHQSDDERDRIERHRAPYEALADRGVIGPEERIRWLDALRSANQSARPFAADYQISVQQPYPYARELNANGLGLAQSLMKLDLRLAHEGELPRFLAELEAANVGTFEINQCVLERLTVLTAVGPRLQPNVRAECELAWITMNPEPPPGRRP